MNLIKNNRTHLRRLRGSFLLLLFLCAALACPAAAAEKQEYTVKVVAAADGMQTDGVQVSLYKVAELNESDGSFVPVQPYDGYGIRFSCDTAGEMKDLAHTLEAYVLRDRRQPTAVRQTDGMGTATFSLTEDGLYLVLGSEAVKGSLRYVPEPTLILLPQRGADAKPLREVTAQLKCELKKITGTPISLRVLKIWSDAGAAAQRPAEIKVQLLQDAKVYGEVILNAENNWDYTWNNLSPAYQWRVAEAKIPANYTCRISCDGSLFTITNSITPDTPRQPGDRQLPNTGVSWLPILILTCVGLLLVLLGRLIKSREEHE